MRIEEWRRIEILVDEALELAPAERRTFLDEASGGEPELPREVESLLACDEKSDGFLAASGFAFAKERPYLLPTARYKPPPRPHRSCCSFRSGSR